MPPVKRQAICPYCRKQLKRFPSRSTNCAFCKKLIVVKTNAKTVRVLVTRQGAERIDTYWRKRQTEAEEHLLLNPLPPVT